MSVFRRFLVAPSLVRLLRKERGGSRITEGYFAPQAGRTSFVRAQGTNCFLVLVTGAEGAQVEERTEVPRAHGDALLDVCAGKVIYERTAMALGGAEAQIDRFVRPAGLDIVSLAFDSAEAAKAFVTPAWFGAEVTADRAYEGSSIALTGIPTPGEIPLSNAALDAVLDLIEPRFGTGRPSVPPAPPKPPAPKESAAPPPKPADPPPSAPTPPNPAPAAAVAAATAPAAAKPEEQPKPAEPPPAAKAPPAEPAKAPPAAEPPKTAEPPKAAVAPAEPAKAPAPVEPPKAAPAPVEAKVEKAPEPPAPAKPAEPPVVEPPKAPAPEVKAAEPPAPAPAEPAKAAPPAPPKVESPPAPTASEPAKDPAKEPAKDAAAEPSKPEEAPKLPEAKPVPPLPAAAAVAAPEAADRLPPDARIDDVIESLSKALGAAIRNPQEPGGDEGVTEAFERWQVRPRRTQQT